MIYIYIYTYVYCKHFFQPIWSKVGVRMIHRNKILSHFFRECFWILPENADIACYASWMSVKKKLICQKYLILNLTSMYSNIYPLRLLFLASNKYLVVYFPLCNQPPVDSLHGQWLFNNFLWSMHLCHVRFHRLFECKKIGNNYDLSI